VSGGAQHTAAGASYTSISGGALNTPRAITPASRRIGTVINNGA